MKWSNIKRYLLETVWRAVLKFATIIVLGIHWAMTDNFVVGASLFAGAALLWITDGIDHGIDALRAQRSQKTTSV